MNNKLKKSVKLSIKNIIKKRKNFLKKVNFSKTSIMGILNLTPDSFSDGGKFNSKKNSIKHVRNLIESGADIIDIGGESTRPGSKTIHPKMEWKRIEFMVKNFKKNLKINVYQLIQENLKLFKKLFNMTLIL